MKSNPSLPKIKRLQQAFANKQKRPHIVLWKAVLHFLLDGPFVFLCGTMTTLANSSTDSTNRSQTFTASNGERFWKRRRIDSPNSNDAVRMEITEENEQPMDTDRSVVAAAPRVPMDTAPTTQSKSPPNEPPSTRRIEYCYYCSCYYCTCRVVAYGSNRIFTSA